MLPWWAAAGFVLSFLVLFLTVAIRNAMVQKLTRVVRAPDGTKWRIGAEMTIATPDGVLQRLSNRTNRPRRRGHSSSARHPPGRLLWARPRVKDGELRTWMTTASSQADLEADLENLARHVGSG